MESASSCAGGGDITKGTVLIERAKDSIKAPWDGTVIVDGIYVLIKAAPGFMEAWAKARDQPMPKSGGDDARQLRIIMAYEWLRTAAGKAFGCRFFVRGGSLVALPSTWNSDQIMSAVPMPINRTSPTFTTGFMQEFPRATARLIEASVPAWNERKPIIIAQRSMNPEVWNEVEALHASPISHRSLEIEYRISTRLMHPGQLLVCRITEGVNAVAEACIQQQVAMIS